eukprot:gene8770-33637_t
MLALMLAYYVTCCATRHAVPLYRMLALMLAYYITYCSTVPHAGTHAAPHDMLLHCTACWHSCWRTMSHAAPHEMLLHCTACWHSCWRTTSHAAPLYHMPALLLVYYITCCSTVPHADTLADVLHRMLRHLLRASTPPQSSGTKCTTGHLHHASARINILKGVLDPKTESDPELDMHPGPDTLGVYKVQV